MLYLCRIDDEQLLNKLFTLYLAYIYSLASIAQIYNEYIKNLYSKIYYI